MKRTHLELGGKNPLLVLDDILNPGVRLDVNGAAQQAVMGCFYHCGQICMASSRIIVQRRCAEGFLAALRARAEALVVAPRIDDDAVAYGPVINQKALRKIEEHVAGARAAGAQVLCGGEVAEGLCYKPTLILLMTARPPSGERRPSAPSPRRSLSTPLTTDRGSQ